MAARLLVLLIPIVGLVYPLLRFVSAIYGWMMRRKIERLYGQLRFLEDELIAGSAGQDAGSTISRLDRLEEQANRLRIPVSYASMQYMLRNHIGLVRARDNIRSLVTQWRRCKRPIHPPAPTQPCSRSYARRMRPFIRVQDHAMAVIPRCSPERIRLS